MNVNRRFQKEIRQLYIQQSQRDLNDNDYLIYYDETDVNKLHTIIRGPVDSVYRHKFIRLDFNIPDNYPHSPPEVTFVNYDGVRIHPNMYENGKCCATILNTWGDDKFEKWTSSMGIETILLTFHSFLDNNPYTYEPGGRDDPSYTVYVQHQSWSSCLIRYLQNETIELFTEFMHNYLLLNIDSIFSDLYELSEIYQLGYYETRCFEIDIFPVNYSRISSILEYYYNYIEFQESHQISSFDEFVNMDYDCCICYDTLPSNEGTLSSNEGTITLGCNHSFHKACLQSHIQANNNICPMCRRELIEEDQREISTVQEDQQEIPTENNVQEENIWMINPLTRRRIKIGGRTYNYLKSNGEL
jgi:ubiquitin-protein ligase